MEVEALMGVLVVEEIRMFAPVPFWRYETRTVYCPPCWRKWMHEAYGLPVSPTGLAGWMPSGMKEAR
jgi:hypothetical protein